MSQSIEIVFQDDEQDLVEVGAHWSQEDLLGKEGVFFLKDVIKVLDELDPLHVKRTARALIQSGRSSWKVMGVRKIWKHWIVRMTVFGPYYRKHLLPKTRRIEKHWDGNILIQQKGTFLFSKVCSLLPFSTAQLRYQAKKNPNAKAEYGIWKDEALNTFLVDMEKFGPWVAELWRGGSDYFDRRKKP